MANFEDRAKELGDAVSQAGDSMRRSAKETMGRSAKQAADFASATADQAYDVGLRATDMARRQIGEQPLTTLFLGAAVGYLLGYLVHHNR